MRKAKRAKDVLWFEDIPNVGKRIAGDFKRLGFVKPQQLKGKNPFTLYQRLCEVTRVRQDPCVLDTLMAAVDFMNGKTAKPWWMFTKARKKKYPHI